MDGVQVEYEYAAPLEQLWRALTERAKIAGWWGENDFVPQVGHRFTVTSIGLAALPGPVECTIAELDLQRRLVMGWRVGTTRATLSLLAEAAGSGSRLIVTRHGAVGPATPVDLDQALHHLFDERLRSVLERVPVGAATASGAVPLPAAPALSGALAGHPGLPTFLGTPARPSRIWPAIATVVVVAIIAIVLLLGSLGSGRGGSGSGKALVPVDRPPAIPGSGAAAPGDDGSGAAGPAAGAPGQPNQPGQAGQPNQPAGATAPTTAAGPPPVLNPPPLFAQMSATFQVVAQRLTSFDVAVTITNSGGASGQWTSVAAALTGLDLHVGILNSTVNYVLRDGTNCFVPAGSIATVAPKASVSFTFTVSALASLLGTISSIALDSPACA